MSAELPAELVEIVEHFPIFWAEAGHLMTETLYAESKLDRKTIELVLCSLLAGRRWELGVKTHAVKAREFGASSDEVRGAILLSFAVFGTSSAAAGLHWAEQAMEEAGLTP
jgi:alkylhydroperoxidase/carboxymuconolactone decarboxylase family protein YurZ